MECDFDKYAFGALRDGFEQLRLAELVPRIAVSAPELPYLSSYDRKQKNQLAEIPNPGFDNFGSMDFVAKLVPSTVCWLSCDAVIPPGITPPDK